LEPDTLGEVMEAVRGSDGRWWIYFIDTDKAIRMEVSFDDGEDKDRMYEVASGNGVYEMFNNLVKNYKTREEIFK